MDDLNSEEVNEVVLDVENIPIMLNEEVVAGIEHGNLDLNIENLPEEGVEFLIVNSEELTASNENGTSKTEDNLWLFIFKFRDSK